jgi:monovalent cation:H+ antiporter-2, CPA2 family
VLIPLLAITQPFVPALSGAPVLALLLIVAAATFWRRSGSLQQHIVAGAQMVVEALAMAPGAGELAADAGVSHGMSHDVSHGEQHEENADPAEARPPSSMADVERLLPGIGSLRRLRVAPDARAVGSSLRELDLRGRTGATVLAIARDDQQLVAPDGHEVLRAGDVLALTGTHEAIDAAEALLAARASPPRD